MAGAQEFKDYRTISGQERYDQINHEDFKVDLKKFIDPNSNKIKFKISGTKKLLPYNGFYPQQRTMQIAGIFNKVYLDNTDICTDEHRVSACSSSEGELSSGSQGLFATLAATQPLFSPGILFNTIKAGIAVDWPTYITNSENMTKEFLYSTESYYTTDVSYHLGNINSRLPFEALLDPPLYYNYACRLVSPDDTSISIPYIDPTHISYLEFYKQINNITNIPHINVQQISLMQNARYKNIYQSAINNFLYETVNFFLKDKSLTHFYSGEFNLSDKIDKEPNKAYTMDVVIRKNPNFSMFNTIGYSGSNQYVHSASLFGPPCSSSHELLTPYLPYAPPYFRENGESRIRLTLQSGSQYSLTPSMQEVLGTVIVTTNPGEVFSIFDAANYNRMTLHDSMFIRNKQINGDKIRWYIQTKFETPLINFSKCSTVEVTSSNNILKAYPEPYVTD